MIPGSHLNYTFILSASENVPRVRAEQRRCAEGVLVLGLPQHARLAHPAVHRFPPKVRFTSDDDQTWRSSSPSSPSSPSRRVAYPSSEQTANCGNGDKYWQIMRGSPSSPPPDCNRGGEDRSRNGIRFGFYSSVQGTLYMYVLYARRFRVRGFDKFLKENPQLISRHKNKTKMEKTEMMMIKNQNLGIRRNSPEILFGFTTTGTRAFPFFRDSH